MPNDTSNPTRRSEYVYIPPVVPIGPVDISVRPVSASDRLAFSRFTGALDSSLPSRATSPFDDYLNQEPASPRVIIDDQFNQTTSRAEISFRDPEELINESEEATIDSESFLSIQPNPPASRSEREALEVTLQDLRVRYHGCFGIKIHRDVETPSRRDVIFATDFDIDRDRREVRIYYYDANGRSNHEKYDPELFSFPWPSLGMINTEFGALYFTRKHKKRDSTRYRRGFRFDLVNMSYISSLEYSYLSTNPPLFSQRDNSIQWETNRVRTEPPLRIAMGIFYELLFRTKYPTFATAGDNVVKYRLLSEAFSSQYVIQLSKLLNCFIIKRGNFKVAAINFNTREVVLLTDLFRDEMIKLGVIQ